MTFEVSRSFAGVVFVVAAGVASLGTAAGCSSSSETSPSVEAGNSACPATFDATIGAACTPEGNVCDPTFTCGFATVTVRCLCTQGTYVCMDGSGNPMQPGDTPSCGKGRSRGPAPPRRTRRRRRPAPRPSPGSSARTPRSARAARSRTTGAPAGRRRRARASATSARTPATAAPGRCPTAGSSSGGQDAAPEAQPAGDGGGTRRRHRRVTRRVRASRH